MDITLASKPQVHRRRQDRHDRHHRARGTLHFDEAIGAKYAFLAAHARGQRRQSMAEALETPLGRFMDRRSSDSRHFGLAGERRQFTNGHENLSPAAAELATAIDTYKLRHRRRFVTYEEILNVVLALGYHK
jgi:hypothetical protein